MKKLFSFLTIAVATFAVAQTTANRFFYELNFKPKKDSAKTEKVMTILDITPEKSLYRDFTVVAQDSLYKAYIEEMQKSRTIKDAPKSMTTPKFGYKVFKALPSKEITYTEAIINGGFSPISLGFNESLNFEWSILSEKEKIGEYNTQKATVDFGGRHWTAWFSTEIPFQDGPYKFYGLPGLIVKLEDADKNYSWELKGNKKVDDWQELSYIENLQMQGNTKINLVTKEKFEKTMSEYKKDPFSSIRPMLTSEMLSQRLPGSDQTIGEMVKKQEKQLKDFYKANDNPIEITDTKTKK